jgi:O-antigen ligase
LFFGEGKFSFSKLFKYSWDILLYLLVLSLGILYTSDKQTGFRTLETSFALLALPIISSRIQGINRDRLNFILIFFSLGVLTAGLICLINSVYTYLNNGQSNAFFYYDFTEVINSHPTYLAYYLILAITFGLYAMNYEKIELPMWVILSFVLFCFPILLLTGGQSAFVSLLFVFSFFILKYLLGERGKTESISFGVVALMLIGILFINTGHHDEREQMLNDSWDRFELWRSGIFANTDFLWGVGTGDYKSVLNEYYRKTGQELFARESLNSHNQFIQIFFSNGFLGLIAFSIIIIRPLYMAFRNNDQLGILLIFPFLIYGMTEVFLGRYQGVVFFALLHQTLVSFYVNSKSTLIEIK